MEGHMPACVGRRRAGCREHLGGARAAQLVGKVGLRLYQDAGPAEWLEVPGLRCLAGTIGADLDEESGATPAEEVPHELLLASFGQSSCHDRLRASCEGG